MASSFPWPIEYRLSQRRKTVGLEVREGRVLVRAPVGYSRDLLNRLVQSKAAWIASKVAQQYARMATRPAYQYCRGECLPYLGRHITLDIWQGKQGAVLDGEVLWVGVNSRSRRSAPEQAYEAVKRWYRARALALLEQKTRQLCALNNLRCGSVRVRATRSKWGHCTNAGDIQYNWQILLAPEPVVDYLVAHEVSHLRFAHHGPAFWQQVGSFCPGFEPHRLWLRDNGHTLILPEPE